MARRAALNGKPEHRAIFLRVWLTVMVLCRLSRTQATGLVVWLSDLLISTGRYRMER